MTSGPKGGALWPIVLNWAQFGRSWPILGSKNPPSGPLWDHLGAILCSIWLALLRSAVILDVPGCLWEHKVAKVL